MTTNAQILHFIKTVRESSPLIPTIYLNGSCYRFYLILKAAFPNVEITPYYDQDCHVLSRIDDVFYDINGEAKPRSVNPMRAREIEWQRKFVCELSFSAIAR